VALALRLLLAAAVSFDKRLSRSLQAALHTAGLTEGCSITLQERWRARTLSAVPCGLQLALESVASEVNSVGRHRRPGLAFGRWAHSGRPALRRGAGRQNPRLAGSADGLVRGLPGRFELNCSSILTAGPAWTDFWLLLGAPLCVQTLLITSLHSLHPSEPPPALPPLRTPGWAVCVQKWRALQAARVAERQP
jgi:hypothetical protein